MTDSSNVATSAFLASGEIQSTPLDQIGIAPENLRAREPADADIPELAETIAAADLIYPLLVRPGRKGEVAWMALDGRRRLMALQLLVENGREPADRTVRIQVVRTKAEQAAAIVIANTQRAPVHVADVIVAIGKLTSRKMSGASPPSGSTRRRAQASRPRPICTREQRSRTGRIATVTMSKPPPRRASDIPPGRATGRRSWCPRRRSTPKVALTRCTRPTPTSQRAG